MSCVPLLLSPWDVTVGSGQGPGCSQGSCAGDGDQPGDEYKASTPCLGLDLGALVDMLTGIGTLVLPAGLPDT